MMITFPSTLLRPFSVLAIAAAAFAALSVAPVSVSAQTTTKTIHGDFKDGDGNKGTYVTTVTTNDATTTEETVLTRRSDKATSTDTKTTVKNSDDSKTVTYSHNDFGATAQFTSSKTVTPEKHGEAYGNGTYTTAAGVSGVLATLESNIGNVTAVHDTFTTATGVTSDLRLRDSELGFTADKTITLNPDGTVSTEVNTRYITHVQ